ncbi:MAG: MFS transporter [Acidimicrobiia bacterium]
MGGTFRYLTREQRGALGLISISQLLALSLWFSATAVAGPLVDEWSLSANGEAALTLSVQVGFVAGALGLAILNVADIFPSRRIFFLSAMAGSLANLGLLLISADTAWVAFVLRFATGVALAGVYPSGLKVMAGWFREGRGMALGVLVGALTVGSASPHLTRGLGLDWPGVIVASSVLAAAAGLLMSRISDGPYEVPVQRFRWDQVATVIGNRGVRLSTYGYLGHMWELYAMWTWIGAFVLASAEVSGVSYGPVPVVTFLIIASGFVSCVWAGTLADRLGRTGIAGGALVISGSCALLTPLVFGASPWIALPVLFAWGLAVIADSAQFSAMVTETAEDRIRGTALTLQTAVGFLLTLVTIRGVPSIAEALTWRWAFPVLAVGPVLGVLAMRQLKRSGLLAVAA